jgi:3-hydroxyisobutyrate dehydrogenase
MNPPTKVAFIGLGVMGFPMAGHLQQAGFDVCVFNRNPAKAEAWVGTYGGRRAASPREAAADAEIVLACVGADSDVREVTVRPQGAFQGMKLGSVFVDHTTASAKVAQELAAEADGRGLRFLDAPISGGQVGAEKGVLTIMVGGDARTLEDVRPALSTYAQAVNLMGPVGSGQLTKMVNQIIGAGIVQSLSEGLNFARIAGLDGHKVVEVLSKGAARSFQMENRGPTMVDDEFDFPGFAVDWMAKDLGLCLEEGRARGVPLPVTEQIHGFYRQLQARGGGRWDFTSLIRLLRGNPASGDAR